VIATWCTEIDEKFTKKVEAGTAILKTFAKKAQADFKSVDVTRARPSIF
jgi:hypothetical protein